MRLKQFILLVFLLGINQVYGQPTRKPTFVEPSFPGGTEAWVKYISDNLEYPSLARQTNINGRVILEFIVEKDGSVSNVKVTKGLGAGCDEEALRVVSASPKWNPAIYKGKPSRYTYSFPIRFQLSNKDDEDQANQ